MQRTQTWKIGEATLSAGVDIRPHEIRLVVDKEPLLWSAFIASDHPAIATLALGQPVEVWTATDAGDRLRWWAGELVDIDTVIGGVVITTRAPELGDVPEQMVCNHTVTP